MSKRQLKAEDVDGFVLAAHDEIKDTCARYGVEVYTRIVFDRRRGQMKLVMVAVRRSETHEEREYARAEREYPSPRYTSLHGLLYACAMSLNIAVQRAYHTQHGHYLGDAPAEGRE